LGVCAELNLDATDVISDLAETEKTDFSELEDSAKRRQIMNGAREVFLARGFDGASMGEIARKARVSKGTLYVYFDSKEQLFEAVAYEACAAEAEAVFSLDLLDRDVEAVLTRLGQGFVKFLCRSDAMPPLRTIMSISERMPEIGRKYYESGPACGIERLRLYLATQVDAGLLQIEDCEVAAAQFLDSCLATILRPLLFNASGAPSEERIDHVVGIAVRTFLAAYRRTQPGSSPGPRGMSHERVGAA
jgi:AcrR family transcriptional regulator